MPLPGMVVFPGMLRDPKADLVADLRGLHFRPIDLHRVHPLRKVRSVSDDMNGVADAKLSVGDFDGGHAGLAEKVRDLADELFGHSKLLLNRHESIDRRIITLRAQSIKSPPVSHEDDNGLGLSGDFCLCPLWLGTAW